jgi:WD40 repeat protein
MWQLSGGGRVVCFSADGSILAASDEPGKGTLVVGTADLAPRGRIPGGWLPVGFTPHAAEIVGIRNDGTMQRWSCSSTSLPLIQETPLFDEPTAVGSSAALSLDGRVLVVGNTRGKVAIWDLTRRERLRLLNSENDALHFVAVSADGDFVLTGGTKTSHARLWHVPDGKRRAVFGVSGAQPLCGAFSPASLHLAIGWSDGTVELRQSTTGHLLHRIRSDSALVQSIAFSPDGQRIACGGPEGAIRVFATDDAREILTLRAELLGPNRLETTISSLAFSEHGNALAAYLNDGRIRIWRF